MGDSRSNLSALSIKYVFRDLQVKMMFNGLPVFSVVLVVAIVFLGSVVADTEPGVIPCRQIYSRLARLEEIPEPCSAILFSDLEELYRDARRYCPDDWTILQDIYRLMEDIADCVGV